MTRSPPIALTVSFALVGLVGCGRDHDPRAPDPASQLETGEGLTPASGALGPGPPSPEREPAAQSDRLTDGQVLAIAAAVNAAEVDHAKMAIGRARKAAVKEFAQMMIAHHGKAAKDVNALSTRLDITPADSELMTKLRVDAAATQNDLEKEDANDFDEEYIEAQVEMHEKALKKLDERLLPSVQNAELKTLLQTMRAQVADHLVQARIIDKSLD